MDNYDEYFRMSKLMTKIHAQKLKKAWIESNENENIIGGKIYQDVMKEERKDKFVSSIKFQYKNASNRDVSMEEEDEHKEPFQNFSNTMYQSKAVEKI